VSEAAAREAAARFGGEAVTQEGPQAFYRPRDPQQEIALLARESGLPPDLHGLLPGKWEKLGDVVVLKLPEPLLPYRREVGALYARALRARTVLRDVGGVAGELREMRETEFLVGSEARAVVVENGIEYALDASRIMFSSGNVEERRRIGELDARGETVVDMFAGIGYFTLPLAVHAGAACVHALELNPGSFAFLQENVARNGAEGVVRPWHGDNRDFPLEGIAHRVHMGYFPGTARFLPKAMRLLRPEGGVVHFHDTFHESLAYTEPVRLVQEAAAAVGREARPLLVRAVKSHSPGILHMVADMAVGPRQH